MTIVPTTQVLAKNITLTKIQKEVMIGNILGDGYLRRSKITQNPSLTIDQTYPKHENYVNHLYSIYYNLTLSKPKIIIRKPDRRTNLVYSTIRFSTRALPCIIPIYNLFYYKVIEIDGNEKYKRSINSTIKQYITARSLAY